MNTQTAKAEDIDPSQLALNLRSLLDHQKITITELAQELKIPVMTIRRLLSSETTDPRISTLRLIASYFDVSVDSLFENSNAQVVKAEENNKPILVPVLDWDILQKVHSINEIDLVAWKNWQPISLNTQGTVSKKAFALESRPSMNPRFPQGTLFIIDPSISPKDGDIVLIRIHKELTLRILTIDAPEWKLHPIVSDSMLLDYDNDMHEIVGVNLLTLLFNRRIQNKY